MPDSIRFRIRYGEKAAVATVIESWKAAHEDAMKAQDVAELVHKCLEDWVADRLYFQEMVARLAGADREQLDEANTHVQEVCDVELRIHALVRENVGAVAQRGHRLEHLEELDKATEDYRNWKEDIPVLLAMGHGPVRKVLQERVQEALTDTPKGSDWQDLFTDEEDSCEVK